jgi:micrococcal nuclease
MLSRERAARGNRAGLWAEPAFQPREAASGGLAPGGFRIVRGRVQRVAPMERQVYLNFGHDWRTDFTVRIGRPELEPHFARSGIDVEGLAGRRIEVRGVVLDAGGPLIEVSHPEQIEVLP